MPRSTRIFTPALSGSLIAFVDFFALLGQAQFLMATYERMRQPLIADLAVAADARQGGDLAPDIALVAVVVAADGTIHIDDEADPVALAALGGRLAPLEDKPGTAFLHGDPTADWGTIQAVQRVMTVALARQIVAPILQ